MKLSLTIIGIVYAGRKDCIFAKENINWFFEQSMTVEEIHEQAHPIGGNDVQNGGKTSDPTTTSYYETILQKN